MNAEQFNLALITGILFKKGILSEEEINAVSSWAKTTKAIRYEDALPQLLRRIKDERKGN